MTGGQAPGDGTRRALLIDGSWDPATREGLEGIDDLIPLCWLAADTRQALEEQTGVRCHELADLVGSADRWERKALEWVDHIRDSGPTHLGEPWRELIAEGLLGEARILQATRDAAHYLQSLAPGTEPRVRLSPAIVHLAAEGLADPARSAPETPSPSFAARLQRRLRHIALTGEWREQLWNLGDELDRNYALRLRLEALRPKAEVAPGGTVFFSSYLNNTRTLEHFVDLVPGEVHWLIANRYALPRQLDREPVDWLWRFAPRRMPSPLPEPLLPGQAQDLPPDEKRLLAAWMERSPTWAQWLRSGRIALPRLTACWEAYLERARPSLVVLAGAHGLDGWLGRIARRRGVPVVQLMHGILGGAFYTERPPEADIFVIWGSAWRELWPETKRDGMRLSRPRGIFPKVRRRESEGLPRLTYFSWPFDRLPFYNAGELLDGMIDLFQRLLQGGLCRLTLRAHPLENLSDLLNRWRIRHGEIPQGVTTSQREPLSHVMRDTDVAVLFRSTVLLDGLANQLPMAIPAWPDFPDRQVFEGAPGLYFAPSFQDLEATLRTWLQDPPVPDRTAARRFLRLADQGRQSLEEVLQALAETAGP